MTSQRPSRRFRTLAVALAKPAAADQDSDQSGVDAFRGRLPDDLVLWIEGPGAAIADGTPVDFEQGGRSRLSGGPRTALAFIPKHGTSRPPALRRQHYCARPAAGVWSRVPGRRPCRSLVCEDHFGKLESWSYAPSDADHLVALSLRAQAPVFDLALGLGLRLFVSLRAEACREGEAGDVRDAIEAEGARAWVADVAGIARGFVTAFSPRASLSELVMAALDPRYRRQGLASPPIDAATASLCDQDATTGIVETGDDPGRAPARGVRADRLSPLTGDSVLQDLVGAASDCAMPEWPAVARCRRLRRSGRQGRPTESQRRSGIHLGSFRPGPASG